MTANPRHLPLSIVVVIWLNALPYLSRLPRGTDWVAQYLPDEGFLVPGLIFIHLFYSLPAIPLIWALRHKEKPGLIWSLAFLVATALTWSLHKDYDLYADAQAAIGLVNFPLISMVVVYGVLAFNRELRQVLYESIRGKFIQLDARENSGLLARIPWFRDLPGTIRTIIGLVLFILAFSLISLVFGP